MTPTLWITRQRCAAIALFGAAVMLGFAGSSMTRGQPTGNTAPPNAAESPDNGNIPPTADDGVRAIDHDRNWPQWRGPLGTGVAPHGDPPVEWGEKKNIRWKVELPGKGHSTPAVWGDRVFITTAIPHGDTVEPGYSGAPGAHNEVPITRKQMFTVIAINRRDGEIIWQRTVREELPHAGGHVTASLASASPVTDGELLFAYFGSAGLYCLNAEDGELLWEKDFGRMHTHHGHGEGSSPALSSDTLVINWDHEGDSFLVALDKRTGTERWKTARGSRSSWSTPVIVNNRGETQVIVSGSKRLVGYDLATGEVIWECGGLSAENVVATPVAGDGMVYAGSSYDRQAMLGIRFAGATGDITGTDRVVWIRRRGPPYVPSPLLYQDALYFHAHYRNVLTRVDAATGEDRPGPFRLDGIGIVFASPVAAAGRVYITDREGATLVLNHSDEPEILALNHLNDSFSASPALADRELFLRGERNLYCIAESLTSTEWYEQALSLVEDADEGDKERALTAYNRSVAMDPREALVWANRGTLLLNMERYEEALESYEHSLALRPDSAYVYCSRATVFNRTEKPKQALLSADKALKCDSSHRGALLNKAKALEALGRPEEAEACRARAAKLKREI